MDKIIEKHLREMYTRFGYDVVEVKLYKSVYLAEITIKKSTCLHHIPTEDNFGWKEQSLWFNYLEMIKNFNIKI